MLRNTRAAGCTLSADARVVLARNSKRPRRPTVCKQVQCLLVVALVPLAPSGCSRYIDPNVPEPIRPYVEPERGGEYLLYRPSSYKRDRSWPLIVACHGSFPDSPGKRIRAWTQDAESYGFLVAVPELKGVKRTLGARPRDQAARRRDDERHILATIRHIRAAHNVSEDRIFIHGWSGGACVALHTGLRHPDIFRAIAVSQPKCDESHLSAATDAIDRHQPVFVNYSVVDAVTGEHARSCLDWLRSHGTKLKEDSHGAVRATDTRRSVEFFEEVIRKEPWIRIRAFPGPGGDPLQIQFKLQCSYGPTQYRWEFGDREEAVVAEPLHAYAEPGTYRVTVTVDGPKGEQHRRSVKLKVPD